MRVALCGQADTASAVELRPYGRTRGMMRGMACEPQEDKPEMKLQSICGCGLASLPGRLQADHRLVAAHRVQ
jgi:hypothetical protein